MFHGDALRTERILLFIALIFIIIIAVKMTAYVITIFLMALILTLLFMPCLFWLKNKGFKDLYAVLVITTVATLVLLGIILLTLLSFNSLIADIPQFQTELNARLLEISTFLSSIGISSITNGAPT
ncbi:MAG: AI-2E family transporter, partial [Methanoregula sp.]|nr:AI-2E family transporter [Methanoregula sp.]